jgi:hypothetical protein
MNTTKIAALYGTYHPLHLLSPTDPLHQQVAELLVSKAQRATGGLLDGNRCHLAIKHLGAKARFSPDGKWLYNEVEIYCPQRVHDWALAQQPATNRHHNLHEGEVWSAMTSAFHDGPGGEFMLRFGAKADFAVMLRGVQAYERKQQKRYRKLLAQLRAYHAQQVLLYLPNVVVATAEPMAAAVCAAHTTGLLPRLYGKLRRELAVKVHQVAVAAEAVLGEGAQVA